MIHLESNRSTGLLAEDLALEGEPEKEFNPGIAGRIPGKTVAGGALITDDRGRILFVVPVYKPYLEIPGGIADANESPDAACRREIREELQLDLNIGGLLVVDWVPQHGVWRDSLQFIFDGGVLASNMISKINLPSDELASFQFCHLEAVEQQLKPSLYRRLTRAVEARNAKEASYAEFGRK
ncbi:NUDIX hydrolase [Amycolatopsis minnesotensis]|uniref:NUDIX hydrolase n=1 Tax=Amycolatopsis minnesotensis TaxID=337894 RepID=A0ABN2SH87_9PSEU